MTRSIDIVGTGLGPETLTAQAAESIAHASLLIGSPRVLSDHARPGQDTVSATRPEDVIDAVLASADDHVAVLMSGDTGFHSGATKVYAGLRSHADLTVRHLPGISSPCLLAARVGVPWEDARLVSCHGTSSDLVAQVRRHHRVIALTGGNVPELAERLIVAGFGELCVWAAENLGASDERVTRTAVKELSGRAWASLTTLLIENPSWDDRVLFGIPDDRFVRGDVPMTKAAVRAFAMAQLGLRPRDICYDIGCGTGSVSVEMALGAYEGHVYAVDKSAQAVGLTHDNCRTFHIGNVTVEEGIAPDALSHWPNPDAVFIGGTSRAMSEIVSAVVERNPDARVVVTAIAIESVAAALGALTLAGLTTEVTQITAANGREVAGLHMLMGQNPVTVIRGGPRE